ncbi:MAG: hypothetical protein U9R41_07025 [Candidatus Marinimicrobia bacterium]|nr:hypothetical protein [Candidatus Neomarinimicrobiota bacterium]
MKIFKTLIIIIFITTFLFSADAVSIVPSDKTMIGGNTEIFDVNINNAFNLSGFDIRIKYNTDYISSFVLTEGTFLDNADGNTTQWYVTGVAGDYIAHCTILGPTEGATGNGKLFTIEITTKDVNYTVNSDILLYSAIFSKSDDHPDDQFAAVGVLEKSISNQSILNSVNLTIWPNWGNIDIIGNWDIINISENDIINSNEVESADNFVYLDVSGFSCNWWFCDNWRIDVKKTDINWNENLVLSLKRVNDGHADNNGEINGGTNYQIITNSNQLFCEGEGDRKRIYLQNKLGGLSYQIPPDTYSTTIQFTIIDE